jgi:hypothetical protein
MWKGTRDNTTRTWCVWSMRVNNVPAFCEHHIKHTSGLDVLMPPSMHELPSSMGAQRVPCVAVKRQCVEFLADGRK